MNDYRCLACGATHGQPAEEDKENWWWRVLTNGRVGPFHDPECVERFEMRRPNTDSDPDSFTLAEYSLLEAVAWRTSHAPS